MSENNVSSKKEIGQGDSVNPTPQPAPTKAWVQFDEDGTTNNSKDTPAVIATESVHVNLERSITKSPENTNNVAVLDPKPMRNVELPVATVEPIRQGFCRF